MVKSFKSSAVFQGLSVETNEDNINSLQQAFVEVTKAWPISRIKLAPSTPQAAFSDDAAAANYSVHQWTGVDKAHAAGIFGKGATVAIVDTGTDYTHPAVRFIFLLAHCRCCYCLTVPPRNLSLAAVLGRVSKLLEVTIWLAMAVNNHPPLSK